MCCSFGFVTVQKAGLENLVRHNKGLILGSRKQVIFKNSRSLASAFPDAACPFIFLTSLWPASILQIWILPHPLTGRETRVRNVFLLSSWTNYFALLPLQVLYCFSSWAAPGSASKAEPCGNNMIVVSLAVPQRFLITSERTEQCGTAQFYY